MLDRSALVRDSRNRPVSRAECPETDDAQAQATGGSNGPELGEDTPVWLRAALSSWRNPVFAPPTEAEIPVLDPLALGSNTRFGPSFRGEKEGGGKIGRDHRAVGRAAAATREAGRHALPAIQLSSRFFTESASPSPSYSGSSSRRATPGSEGCAHTHTSRGEGAHAHAHGADGDLQNVTVRAFSKRTLSTARVVAQVDRKFVVCVVRIPQGDGGARDGEEEMGEDNDAGGQKGSQEQEVLVCIDQHAADGEHCPTAPFWGHLSSPTRLTLHLAWFLLASPQSVSE